MALDYFCKSLLRIAQRDGREVLEAIVFGQFDLLRETGGKQMVSTSAGGKSFTYMVPSNLSIDQYIGRVEEALEFFDSLTDAQVTTLLSSPRVTKTVADFQ